jgi:hypothetical protein
MYKLSIPTIASILMLAGCGGPAGEFGSQDWCESIKEMSQEDRGKYIEGLNVDERREVSNCIVGLGYD